METFLSGIFSGNIDLYSGSEMLSGSLTSYSPKCFNADWHAHENAHFSFLLDGNCVEKKKEHYRITPGMITYYHPGEFHQVCNVTQPTRRINIELTAAFFQEHSISEQAVREAVVQNPEAKFIMVKMYHELLQNDELSLASVQMLLLGLMVRASAGIRQKAKPGWVDLVSAYLQETFTESVSLNDLSDISNVGAVTISRYFPIYFGCTLGEYIRKLRVEKALALLKSTPESLTEIALECGFYDQSHFTRTFKQVQGILPKRYRKL